MLCDRCHCNIPEGSLYCPNCGRKKRNKIRFNRFSAPVCVLLLFIVDFAALILYQHTCNKALRDRVENLEVLTADLQTQIWELETLTTDLQDQITALESNLHSTRHSVTSLEDWVSTLDDRIEELEDPSPHMTYSEWKAKKEQEANTGG